MYAVESVSRKVFFKYYFELSSIPRQTGTKLYAQQTLYAIGILLGTLYVFCAIHFSKEKFTALPLENTGKKCTAFVSPSFFSRHVSHKPWM
jgi:hypothetical protein